MIKIRFATKADTTILALLGRLTWAESHGNFIEDYNDVLQYLNENFSVSEIKKSLDNTAHLYFIISVDDLPVGYAKLVVSASNQYVVSQNSCKLERIFILKDFIALKIGQKLLTFVEAHVKKLKLDTMWLTVYIKNYRAIRFYEKNEFKNVGDVNFSVNGTGYKNSVFSKKLC